MLYFQVACAQNFKRKMTCFVLPENGISLLICKNFGKNDMCKYRRATPKFPVFYILRCLKMHN